MTSDLKAASIQLGYRHSQAGLSSRAEALAYMDRCAAEIERVAEIFGFDFVSHFAGATRITIEEQQYKGPHVFPAHDA